MGGRHRSNSGQNSNFIVTIQGQIQDFGKGVAGIKLLTTKT